MNARAYWLAEEAKERAIAERIADGGLGYGFRQSVHDDAMMRADVCRRCAEEGVPAPEQKEEDYG